MKLLIADRLKTFCDAVSEQFSCGHTVKTCYDGRQLMDLCRSYEPDILVLDMEMPYIDGIGFLYALSTSGRKMDIVATTACLHSDYVFQTLVRLGVQCILPRPCTVAAVVSRVYDMIAWHGENIRQVEAEVNSLLLQFGFRMSLSGYECLYEALVLMLQDPRQQVTKVIYPEVAVKCGGNAKRVERAIRCVIRDAWKHRDDSLWRMYFSPDQNGVVNCPANSYFMSRMVMCLDNRKIG